MAELRITLRKHDDSLISKGAKNTIKEFFDQALIQYFLDVIEDEALYDVIRANDYHIDSEREGPNYNRVHVSAILPAGPILNAFNCNNFTARANNGLLDEFFERYDLEDFEVYDCAILVEGGKRRSSKRRTSAKKTTNKKTATKRRSSGGKRRRSSQRRRI